MGKKTLSREAKKNRADAEPKGPVSAAANKVAKVAEKVKEVVSHAAHAVQEHVVQPVAEAVGIVKKRKKTRFVREKKEKQPRAKATPLPARSTKRTGKMMSKNIRQAPKEETGSAPKRHVR